MVPQPDMLQFLPGEYNAAAAGKQIGRTASFKRTGFLNTSKAMSFSKVSFLKSSWK